MSDKNSSNKDIESIVQNEAVMSKLAAKILDLIRPEGNPGVVCQGFYCDMESSDLIDAQKKTWKGRLQEASIHFKEADLDKLIGDYPLSSEEIGQVVGEIKTSGKTVEQADMNKLASTIQKVIADNEFMNRKGRIKAAAAGTQTQPHICNPWQFSECIVCGPNCPSKFIECVPCGPNDSSSFGGCRPCGPNNPSQFAQCVPCGPKDTTSFGGCRPCGPNNSIKFVECAPCGPNKLSNFSVCASCGPNNPSKFITCIPCGPNNTSSFGACLSCGPKSPTKFVECVSCGPNNTSSFGACLSCGPNSSTKFVECVSCGPNNTSSFGACLSCGPNSPTKFVECASCGPNSPGIFGGGCPGYFDPAPFAGLQELKEEIGVLKTQLDAIQSKLANM